MISGRGWPKVLLAPTETSPLPLCQMPACESWSVPMPDSSLHMVVTACELVLTPTTMPR